MVREVDVAHALHGLRLFGRDVQVALRHRPREAPEAVLFGRDARGAEVHLAVPERVLLALQARAFEMARLQSISVDFVRQKGCLAAKIDFGNSSKPLSEGPALLRGATGAARIHCRLLHSLPGAPEVGLDHVQQRGDLRGRRLRERGGEGLELVAGATGLVAVVGVGALEERAAVRHHLAKGLSSKPFGGHLKGQEALLQASLST